MLTRVETFQRDGSALEGRPVRVETSEHGLTVLDTTPDGRKRSFVFITIHRMEDSERTDDVRIEEKRYSYDAFGNVVREVYKGSGTKNGAAQATRAASNRYTVRRCRDTVPRLDRPSRVTVRDRNGALLTEKRLYYDGPDFVGLPLGQCDRGLKTREEEWALTEAEFEAHYAGMDQDALGYSTPERGRGRLRVRDAAAQPLRWERADAGRQRSARQREQLCLRRLGPVPHPG